MPSVLIIDDETNIRRMVGAVLAGEGMDVRDAPDATSGLAMAADSEPDVVLLDLMMPGTLDGMGALERLRARFPELPVVMMSGRAGLADAVKAARLGACNFLEKPLTPEGVLVALSAALELRQAKREARALREDLGLSDRMIGESEALAQVKQLVARVAPTDARVLITGESGTGKELVALAIHLQSARRERPFVRVNCAAIPRDLVESEMFGHERGAFTGATERRIGKFELAHTGTLFLDEVGDLGAEAQAKLLRAIESREIDRVGGSTSIRIDTRIVAATNHDLERASANGTFRHDLLFRLNVIPIGVPPLRDRREDIPALVAHLSDRCMRRTGQPSPAWSDSAVRALCAYSWPGNIRELANIVERLAILQGGVEVRAADVLRVLPQAGALGDPLPDAAGVNVPLSEALDNYERQLIRRALLGAEGNLAEAARRLQTDRPNLYRRIRRLGMSDDETDAKS